MGHFLTLVFSRNAAEIQDILNPFNFDQPADSPYSEFIEDESFTITDAATGRRGYWTNPDGKFDYYNVGGRYTSFLRHRAGFYVTSAPVEQLLFSSPSNADFARALRVWDEHQLLRPGVSTSGILYGTDPDNILAVAGDRKTFAGLYCRMLPYSFIGPVGIWHQSDERPLFGRCYYDTFMRYVRRAKIDKLMVTAVDCHL